MLPDTLFTLRLSEYTGSGEYTPFVYDTIRMVVIQFMYQVMMSIAYPKEFTLFQGDFIEYLIYLCLGIMMYWLVIRQLVKIV